MSRILEGIKNANDARNASRRTPKGAKGNQRSWGQSQGAGNPNPDKFSDKQIAEIKKNNKEIEKKRAKKKVHKN